MLQLDPIEEKFEQLVEKPSDINEHLRTLKRLSSQCNVVVELGVRGGVSSYALLFGRPKEMHSFDINPIGSLEKDLIAYAQQTGTDWFFYHDNVLTTQHIPECDMLFVDTHHSYKQMACELYLHGNKARKYLVFHDVTIFGHQNELGQIITNNFTDDLVCYYNKLDNKQGIMPAIEEFLAANPHWKIQVLYPNNNGLLVLERQ